MGTQMGTHRPKWAPKWAPKFWGLTSLRTTFNLLAMITERNRKLLLVKVSCTNRDFYIERKPGRPDWWIRFTPPEATRIALGIRGARGRVFRSTGCADERAAVIKAREIIESYWPHRDGAIAAVEERKARAEAKQWATVPEIIERFRKGARTIEDCETMRERTIEDHIRAWLRIIEARYDKNGALIAEKGVRGGCADGPHKRMTADEALDVDLWEKFKKGWLRRVDGQNPRKIIRAKTSIASYMGHARAMFSLKFMPLYEGLKLPDLRPIREITRPKVAPDAYAFEAISDERFAALDAEINGLRARFNDRDDDGELTRAALDARGIYIAFKLCFYVGLRQGDAVNARKCWIDKFMDVPQISVKARDEDDYIPKGTFGSVSIEADVLNEIVELSGARFPLDYLIPGPNRPRTCRLHSKLIRRYVGAERRNTQHALRAQAISHIVKNDGLEAAVQFARHKGPRMVMKHYHAYLRPSPTIKPGDWQKKNVIPLSAASSHE